MIVKEKLANLLEVRKIIALLTMLLFVGLAIRGMLEPNFVQTVIITIVSFYFGKETALDQPKNNMKG